MQQLKQKSDAKQANANRFSRERAPKKIEAVSAIRNCWFNGERAEVKVVVNKLVETLEAEYSAESAARLVLARIIAKIEKSDPNFHRKQVQSTRRSVKSGKFKYLGRQVKPNLTWGEKANIICFHLHPNLGSKNVDVTCSLFDIIKETTLRGWLNNAPFVRKLLLGELQTLLKSSEVCQKQLAIGLMS